MNSDQLRELISCFNGKVYSLNEIDDITVTEDSYFIINTDSGIGEHWISCCIKMSEKTNSNIIYYYDSLAIPPVLKNIVSFINRNINGKLIVNSYQHQSAKSSFCGMYCVLFLYFMYKNIPFDDFLNLFSDDVDVNDRWIKKFFETHVKNSIKGGGQICRSIFSSQL
jgi:hypothetical protein